MDEVRIDPQARTATVGAGARWQQVIEAAAPHGLAPLNGSSPTVGVVGYTLGGGAGPPVSQMLSVLLGAAKAAPASDSSASPTPSTDTETR